ncbi:MAG: glycosyltransferase family 39 protein, partial [Bacteroidota bacterium]|nr:glycosyltransferase family 39 protein [Bacteroidota bacterium]
DASHSWRQATVVMAARNFLEINNNILYPRIDIGGSGTGITGMEFPLLNYLIYLVSLIFGYDHWYGRLINLIVSSFGVFYFHRIVAKHVSPAVAFNAAIILICSIWFAFSRKIMPDTLSISLVLIGIYHGLVHLNDQVHRWRSLLFFTVLIALGTLAKLPSAYMLVVVLIPFFDRKIAVSRKIQIATALLIGILPGLIWYFHWVPHLVKTYGTDHFFMGKGIGEGSIEILQHFDLVLQRFYDSAMKYTGFIAFCAGMIIAVIKRNTLILIVLAATSFMFSIVILKAGFTFAHHSYYIIPFVPVMALIAGFALAQIKQKKIMYVLLLVIAIEGMSSQIHRFFRKPEDRALLQLEEDLDRISDRDDLILINSGSIPTPMYFAHRKGWVMENASIKDPAFVASLKDEGLRLIVILKKTIGTNTDLDLPVVMENDDYNIYRP